MHTHASAVEDCLVLGAREDLYDSNFTINETVRFLYIGN
jgi:hypothetical protein